MLINTTPKGKSSLFLAFTGLSGALVMAFCCTNTASIWSHAHSADMVSAARREFYSSLIERDGNQEQKKSSSRRSAVISGSRELCCSKNRTTVFQFRACSLWWAVSIYSSAGFSMFKPVGISLRNFSAKCRSRSILTD